MITEVSIFPFQAKAQNYAFFYCTPPFVKNIFCRRSFLRDTCCKILLISVVLKNPQYLRPNSVFRCWTLILDFLVRNWLFVVLWLIINKL